MGVEISVAAGLVSLHLSDFTPHTSHVETGNYTEPRGVLRVENISHFPFSSFAQLFKLRTEAVTGEGGVCSENCKENHRV